MKLTITVDLDNDSFQYPNGVATMAAELRVVLLPVPRKVTEIIAAGVESFRLFDSNGNTVGEAKVEL